MSARLRPSTRSSTAASESLAETNPELLKPKGDVRKTTTVRASQPKGNELARLKRIASLSFFLVLSLLAGLYYLLMNDIIKLYPNSIKLESLKGFNSRAEFALRYQSLLYMWLLINVMIVGFARVRKSALNPLVDSTEKHITSYKFILTNSFEQIIISSFLQLAFVSFAEHVYTMKLIPAINLVQFLGRVAFFYGYPLYRTFGFFLTFAPNFVLVIFNIYKLGSYLGLY